MPMLFVRIPRAMAIGLFMASMCWFELPAVADEAKPISSQTLNLVMNARAEVVLSGKDPLVKL
jgi:hypothetical protein